MALSNDERVAHILRRFAWGAGARERERWAGQDWKAVREALLKGVTEEEPHPYRWAFVEGADAQPFGGIFRIGWVHQMLTGADPLRERMALFWHSHFAAAESKVEDGLMMLDYMQRLRTDPLGKFEAILERMATSPALLKMLDVRAAGPTGSNENFAREVMELHTLGEGRYTERDIKELAGCFSGWTWLNTYYDMEGGHSQKLLASLTAGRGYSAFAIAPDWEVRKTRTILGRKGDFDGRAALQLLSRQDQCRRFVAEKLWVHFAGIPASDQTVDRLAAAMKSSGGEIRAVLREITEQPEFWSASCIRRRVKSPVDFLVGLGRAQGEGKHARALLEQAGGGPSSPVPKRLREAIGGFSYLIGRAGMELLNPPDVGGWPGGQAWISAAAMAIRIQCRGLLLYRQAAPDRWVPDEPLLDTVKRLSVHASKPPAEFVDAFLDLHDAGNLSQEGRQLLEKHFVGKAYQTNFANVEAIAWIITEAVGLLVAAPEYHLH